MKSPVDFLTEGLLFPHNFKQKISLNACKYMKFNKILLQTNKRNVYQGQHLHTFFCKHSQPWSPIFLLISNRIETLHIVQVQKISIHPPQKGLEFPENFKEMCEALLEFPEGWGGGSWKKIPSLGEV